MAQFRKKNKRSLFSRLITPYYRWKVGKCGEGTSFDSVVHLMRYPKNIKLSKNVYIKGGARICPCNERAEVSIGENTTVGYNTNIFASEGISIGDNCMIAPNVYIVDSDHGTERVYLMNEQENIAEKIEVGSDVWLATGVVILKGSRIADGCVVAANSVVKGTLEPYGIYAGIPAKKIGERK